MEGINKQIEYLNELKQTTERLKSMQEQTMNSVLQNASIEDKDVILKLQSTAKQAFELAKKGKVEDAINLTKNFKH